MAESPLDTATALTLDDVVVEEPQTSDAPEGATQGEIEHLERKKQEEVLASAKQDREQRGEYVGRIFSLVMGWLLGVFALLILQGFGTFGAVDFHLSDNLLLAAIGGTTANVLAVFIWVVRYLFPRR